MTYTAVGFSLKLGFKKIVLTQKLVLILNWDSQKQCSHQNFLYTVQNRVKCRIVSSVQWHVVSSVSLLLGLSAVLKCPLAICVHCLGAKVFPKQCLSGVTAGPAYSYIVWQCYCSFYGSVTVHCMTVLLFIVWQCNFSLYGSTLCVHVHCTRGLLNCFVY